MAKYIIEVKSEKPNSISYVSYWDRDKNQITKVEIFEAISTFLRVKGYVTEGLTVENYPEVKKITYNLGNLKTGGSDNWTLCNDKQEDITKVPTLKKKANKAKK